MKKTRKAPRKDPNIYPPGWNHERVRAIIDYYDARQDVDLFKDVELPSRNESPVWVEVPQAILPAVRKLIARHHKKSA
jgi:hypothetical protein